ncbi:VanZ family protein [Nocardioides sp. HDW12B]|nr:VanZ family protein [Nocardioides sp. HDW12B]
MLVLTMLPTDRRAFERCDVAWALPTAGRVELAANVVLFVAPALFASVATRRPALVLVGASATAAMIETVQALVPAIGRSCSTNDWLSNTIGVAIGVLLAVIALRLAGPPRHAECPQEVVPDVRLRQPVVGALRVNRWGVQLQRGVAIRRACLRQTRCRARTAPPSAVTVGTARGQVQAHRTMRASTNSSSVTPRP